jgi:hypothetical protein
VLSFKRVLKMAWPTCRTSAEDGAANAGRAEEIGISATIRFRRDFVECSGFGCINGKAKLLERSESEAWWQRSPNRDGKSASKISESKTREESD